MLNFFNENIKPLNDELEQLLHVVHIPVQYVDKPQIIAVRTK